MTMNVTREEFLVVLERMDADELHEFLSKVLDDNSKLRMLVEGMQWCEMEDADARLCPLYDEHEPYRCMKRRLMDELGVRIPYEKPEIIDAPCESGGDHQ